MIRGVWRILIGIEISKEIKKKREILKIIIWGFLIFIEESIEAKLSYFYVYFFELLHLLQESKLILQ